MKKISLFLIFLILISLLSSCIAAPVDKIPVDSNGDSDNNDPVSDGSLSAENEREEKEKYLKSLLDDIEDAEKELSEINDKIDAAKDELDFLLSDINNVYPYTDFSSFHKLDDTLGIKFTAGDNSAVYDALTQSYIDGEDVYGELYDAVYGEYASMAYLRYASNYALHDYYVCDEMTVYDKFHPMFSFTLEDEGMAYRRAQFGELDTYGELEAYVNDHLDTASAEYILSLSININGGIYARESTLGIGGEERINPTYEMEVSDGLITLTETREIHFSDGFSGDYMKNVMTLSRCDDGKWRWSFDDNNACLFPTLEAEYDMHTGIAE